MGLHTSAHGVTHDLFGSVSEENVARIKRQNTKKISVIIGNPPYNANQANENDNNKNREYPAVDKRIKQTYIDASSAQKTKLYDMYARFFRWASDRLDANGVLAFVTNRSFIDSRTFDGFRKVVAQEFNEIWVVDLKGDARTSGERRRQEGGNVFSDEIRVGVAISICVRKAGAHGCRIRYASVRDYAKADEKREFLIAKRLKEHAFEDVRPDAKGNWLNLTDNDFETLTPIVSKATKAAAKSGHERAVFKLFSLGVSTSRDDWVYGESEDEIREKTAYLIDVYNADLDRSLKQKRGLDASELTYDMKWTRAVKQDLAKGVRYLPEQGIIVRSAYRPFDTRFLHFNGRLVEVQYQQTRLFGERGDLHNIAIAFTDAGSQKPFMALACTHVFDYHFVGAAAAASGVSMYRYDEHCNRIDNITDWALDQFQKHYPSAVTPAQAGVQCRSKQLDSGFRRNDDTKAITKEAIFHYVYAVLHDPLYREKYAQNLKREFPRIPFYADFWQWAAWGKDLMSLHIGYESVEPFPLKRTDVPDEKVRAAGQLPKPSLKADQEAGRIVIDSETTLTGIPPSAWDYRLGNRSALEWILDQYKEKKPKDATIREKFDTYRFADYKEKVIDLLLRVTRVSVETQRIVEAMRAAAR